MSQLTYIFSPLSNMFPSVFLDNSPHHAEVELGDEVKQIVAYLADLCNLLI